VGRGTDHPRALDIDDFVDAFTTWRGTVYIGTGSSEAAHNLSSVLSSHPFRVAPLWELEDIAPTLKAAIHHGGHGITMTCAASGLPSIVLPGHNPERQLNGLRAERVGLARILLPESESPFEWGPAVDQTSHRPSWVRIRAAIEELPARADHMANQKVDAGALVRLLT
jgi:UDP:flavonoid glycosyltransferase YjiC (YdhE family)